MLAGLFAPGGDNLMPCSFINVFKNKNSCSATFDCQFTNACLSASRTRSCSAFKADHSFKVTPPATCAFAASAVWKDTDIFNFITLLIILFSVTDFFPNPVRFIFHIWTVRILFLMLFLDHFHHLYFVTLPCTAVLLLV